MRWFMVVAMVWAFGAEADFDPCHSIVAPGVIDGRIEKGMQNCDLGLVPGGTLIVNSGGGSSSASEAIARRMWYQGITVIVQGRCHSACVRFLAVAERVEVCEGSTIGVHQSSSNYGLSGSSSGTERQVRFLRMTLGAESEPIIKRLLATDRAWVSYVPESEWPSSWDLPIKASLRPSLC